MLSGSITRDFFTSESKGMGIRTIGHETDRDKTHIQNIFYMKFLAVSKAPNSR